MLPCKGMLTPERRADPWIFTAWVPRLLGSGGPSERGVKYTGVLALAWAEREMVPALLADPTAFLVGTCDHGDQARGAGGPFDEARWPAAGSTGRVDDGVFWDGGIPHRGAPQGTGEGPELVR